MSRMIRIARRLAAAVTPLALLAGFGCQSTPGSRSLFGSAVQGVKAEHREPLVQPDEKCPELNLPKELNKVSHPPYMVETPDILIINATRVIPLPPYKVQPLDQLYVVVQNSLESRIPEERIIGTYAVDPDGNPYVYDSATGEVTSAASRVLGS